MRSFALLLMLPWCFGTVVLCAQEPDAAPRADVTGNLATRVVFGEEDGNRVAKACLDLLASCHFSEVSAEGQMPEWDEDYLDALRRRCHLHVRFKKPQKVRTRDGQTVEVTEMLVRLPLNNGRLQVRVGDRARAFAKYTLPECVALQDLLKLAKPVE